MSLQWWSFDAGIGSITAVTDHSDILTVEQIQMWELHMGCFQPWTVGSRQGLCFWAFSISSYASGSATL